MKVLIVDDEPLARTRITRLLADAPGITDLRECENGIEAVDAIGSWRPDLVFLDVQMPGLDGFGVVERVGTTRMPITVFVTAYDEFAVQAFEANALDYLLKPFGPDRLRSALGRARTQVALKSYAELQSRLHGLLGEIAPANRYINRFVVRNGSRMTFVDVNAVDWIGAEGNYLALHSGRKADLVRKTMGEVDRELDPANFVRIHRSTIVRIGAVAAVESVHRGEYVVILRSGTRLRSSSAYRERLEMALMAER